MCYRLWSVPLLVCTLLLAATPAAAPAEASSVHAGETTRSDTVHVAPPTGDKDSDRASILTALESAEPGGTVQFAPGTYFLGEYIHVSIAGLTLLGHPEGTTLRGCDPTTFRDFEVAVATCNGLALTGERQTVRDLTFEHTWQALWVGCCLDPEEVGETPEPGRGGGHLIEGNTFRASINGFRVVGDLPEPVVIRDNDFINVWHAGVVNGRTAHIIGNRVSVPNPEEVPVNGFPGLALAISPQHPLLVEQMFTCAGNVIAENRIEGHPEAIAIFVFGAGGSCRTNEIRDNIVAVSRVRFIGPLWGVLGITDDADSTLAGVPITLADLSDTEIAEFFGLPQETDDEDRIHGNLIQGNRIAGAEGLGIEIFRASRNRIVDNTITGIIVRNPFPGNTMYVPPAWSAGNGSGIWVSPGSNENEILGNTFEEISAAAVVLEGDRNRVVARSASDVIRDLGSANQVTGSGRGGDAAAASDAEENGS